MFLMDGWRAVFRLGIALLREMQANLLSMDMIEMCNYFRDEVRKQKVASNFRIFSEAARVRVNPILVILTSLFSIGPQQRTQQVEGIILHHSSRAQAQTASDSLGH
jgi:hypothetical protein